MKNSWLKDVPPERLKGPSVEAVARAYAVLERVMAQREAARVKLAAEAGDPAAEHGTDKGGSVTVGQEDTRG